MLSGDTEVLPGAEDVESASVEKPHCDCAAPSATDEGNAAVANWLLDKPRHVYSVNEELVDAIESGRHGINRAGPVDLLPFL